MQRFRFTVRRMMAVILVLCLYLGIWSYYERSRVKQNRHLWAQAEWMKRISLGRLDREKENRGDARVMKLFQERARMYQRRMDRIEEDLGCPPDVSPYPLPPDLESEESFPAMMP